MSISRRMDKKAVVPIHSGVFSSVQFTQSCLTLCDPMNRSTPGLPIHHQLPEFTQILVHQSVMPSSHLILCHPLLLLPPIPPNIKVFSNESIRIRWPKYWSFSFSIIPSKEIPGLIYHKTNQEISLHLNFKISNVKKGELRYKNFPW